MASHRWEAKTAGNAMTLTKRPAVAVFSMFRAHMLMAFSHWVREDKPTREEIDTAIAETVSAMRQIPEVV